MLSIYHYRSRSLFYKTPGKFFSPNVANKRNFESFIAQEQRSTIKSNLNLHLFPIALKYNLFLYLCTSLRSKRKCYKNQGHFQFFLRNCIETSHGFCFFSSKRRFNQVSISLKSYWGQEWVWKHKTFVNLILYVFSYQTRCNIWFNSRRSFTNISIAVNYGPVVTVELGTLKQRSRVINHVILSRELIEFRIEITGSLKMIS